MKRYLLIIGILTISLQNADARRWYVTTYGGGTGGSWSSTITLNDLMNKINVTHEVMQNDEVWMQQGTYPALKLFHDSTSWNGLFIRFYGGFAGTEFLSWQRNLKDNETILVGNVGVPSIWVEGGDACKFDGFVLQGGHAEGGGIRLVNNLSEFVNIKIRDVSGDARGGAVFAEGTLLKGGTQSPKLVNVSITDCNLDNPVYVCASSLELHNVTIADNSSPSGVILVDVNGSFVEIYNSIIYGNSNDTVVFGAGVQSGYSYCDYSLLGNSNFAGGTGNNIISDNPAFEDGYHLSEGSPCIDAGNNNYYPSQSALDYDLDGKARKVNIIIDLGAYEYQL